MNKDKELFVEYNITRMGCDVFSSKLRPATEEDISRIKSKPCNHDKQKEQLVYDEVGAVYDMRYCAICNSWLGTV